MEKDYSKLNKEDLVKIVEKLESRKKYGLIWDEEKVKEQFEKDAENALPVLKEITSKEITDKNPSKPVNILIEGDNYHALSVLNFTHQGKIDVIYIDPPYNTGAKDWKYNNDYVDANDPWRHSKWISMMNKRLKLSRSLLKDDGTIIIAIDDYELNTLGLLLDEIFPGHDKSLIVVEHHPQGAGSIAVSRTHEYAYVCTPKDIGIRGRTVDSGESRWPLKRSGQGENNWRKNRYRQFFAILVDPKSLTVIGVGPEIPRDQKKYPTGKTPEGYLRIYPLDKNGGERVWRYNRDTMKRLIEAEAIEYTKNGALLVKKFGDIEAPIFSVWKGPRYNAGTQGSNLLTQIMGKANVFPYPKSLYTVLDMIAMIVKNKKDAIILDYFAGSGTTGHAVMELNKEDGGKRVFILCTNNENNICDEVTLERIKRIIKGYNNRNGEKITGFGGSLKYFKTKFVKKNSSGDDFKTRITHECTEMLCLREGVFDEVKKTNHYRIFRQGVKTLAVYYSLSRTGLPALKKELEKTDGDKTLYCFTLDPVGLSKTEFAGWRGVTLEPIPQKILDVYKQIYEY